jgi:hypothetical protein
LISILAEPAIGLVKIWPKKQTAKELVLSYISTSFEMFGTTLRKKSIPLSQIDIRLAISFFSAGN